ncbi:hypothetical protein OROHE_000257 [Orobanche hederae]
MAAEKEARAFDDPLDGLRSRSSPSTNRVNLGKSRRERRNRRWRGNMKEVLEREEAEARKIRYDNAIKEARDSFRAYAAASKIESDIGQVKLCDEDYTKWAFTRIKCGVPTFAENLDEVFHEFNLDIAEEL